MFACLATLLVAIESTAQPDYVAGRQLLENKTTLFINVESSSARRARMESVLAGTSYARINAITPATIDDKLSPAMSASITLLAREHMAVLLSHLEAIRAVAASALDGRDFAFVAEDDAKFTFLHWRHARCTPKKSLVAIIEELAPHDWGVLQLSMISGPGHVWHRLAERADAAGDLFHDRAIPWRTFRLSGLGFYAIRAHAARRIVARLGLGDSQFAREFPSLMRWNTTLLLEGVLYQRGEFFIENVVYDEAAPAYAIPVAPVTYNSKVASSLETHRPTDRGRFYQNCTALRLSAMWDKYTQARCAAQAVDSQFVIQTEEKCHKRLRSKPPHAPGLQSAEQPHGSGPQSAERHRKHPRQRFCRRCAHGHAASRNIGAR